MSIIELFDLLLTNSINELGFLRLALLIFAIVCTYTYGALTERIKLILIFIMGFIIFGSFVEKLLTAYFKINLSPTTIIIVSGMIGGLMELGAYALIESLTGIITFICGAILSILGFVAIGEQIILSIENKELFILLLAFVAGFGGYLFLTIKRVLAESIKFKIVTSSLFGSFVILFLLNAPPTIANKDLIDILDNLGRLLDSSLVTIDQLPVILLITFTGILSQFFLYKFFRKKIASQ